MKPGDNEIKQAYSQQDIPEPSEEAKKKTIRKATEEFKRISAAPEKKFQGFSLLLRRMGKTVQALIFSKGDPIMTQRQFVTIGIAVIALGLFLSIGPQFFIEPKTKTDPQDSSLTTPLSEKPSEESSSGTPPPVTQKEQKKQALSSDAEDADVPNKGRGQADNATRADSTAPTAAPETEKRQIMKTADKNLAARFSAVTGDSIPGRPAMAPMEGRELPNGGYYKDTGRDTFTEITHNPVKLVIEEPVSTFSIDVDTSSYSFVRRQLYSGVLPQKDAVRVEELINYFSYDYLVPEDRTQPFQPTVALYPTPWNDNTRLLHIGIKGYDVIPDEKPRSNLVFLIDVSGSMNNPNKLPLLKNSFAMLVDSLEPQDTVAIVVYAGAAGTVLEPTEVKEKGKILAALNKLKAGGSTAGGEGIQLAYSLAEMNYDQKAVNRVILATDGDFNVGITNRNELKSFIERKRTSGIFLSVLGFGQGNYNDALMQTLAQNGNGNAAYIDTLNEARKVLVDEAASTLFTIAKDVKIQIEFNPARIHEYRLIGYETRLLKREDFNNDLVDAGDIGSGHTVTAIYEITPVESSEKRIDSLRYQENASHGRDPEAEYAFLKIRYKLPHEKKSRLITRPITADDEIDSLEKVPQDIRFAAAVAAFGQLLRNDPYTGSFGYDDVLNLAEPARGRDKFGYRTEFLNLVRLAKTAKAM